MAGRGGRTRILFLQLPLVDPGNASAGANIPFAGGYLSQAIRAAGLDVEAAFPPAQTVCYGSDAEILAALEEARPDILACTCYMWNVERSLFLGGLLKERLPGCELWIGGPEIQADSLWHLDLRADRVFFGEGESSIVGALEERAAGAAGARVVLGCLADLSAMESPFASGVLCPGPLGQALVETMRGCRSRCRYCYYGKSRPEIRGFGDDAVRRFFSWAAESAVTEVYLMDPALNQHPDLEGFLGKLAEWNAAAIPLHAELSAESVTEGIADRLLKAGLHSVEVGLQSVNPKALRSASRAFDRKKFLAGAAALAARGIEVRTGIILGLPDDDLAGFASTLDFVAQAGLAEGAEVYPLSVLPATAFREEADSFALESLAVPPYTVTSARGWSEEDFASAQDLVAEILDKELYATIVPHFSPPLGPLNRWARLPQLAEPGFRLASSLSVLAAREELEDLALLTAAARRHWSENRHGTLQFLIEATGDIDRPALSLSDRFFDPAHYLERFHIHAVDPQGRFSVRLFQLSPEPRDIQRLMDGRGFCEPVYRIEAGRRPDEELLSEWTPLVAGRAADFSAWESLLAEAYPAPAEMRILLPEG